MYLPEWNDDWRWEFLDRTDRTPRVVIPLTRQARNPQRRDGGKEASEKLTEDEILRRKKLTEERTQADWKAQVQALQAQGQALQKRLGFLDRWQRMTQCERMAEVSLGCVYLMWSPRFETYKIGKTDRGVWVRKKELTKSVDPNIELCAQYLTPVLASFLEMAVHRHFRRFHDDKKTRMLLNELSKKEADSFSEELFKLPEEDADEFLATAATIEKHLLELEVMHLNFCLSKLEADLKKANHRAP